ncbi:Alpha N-terminal protein methyltransferase 1 [Ascosphaera acerosa]|nr:Alpha N-terminal protein methyltransferase 1 [Ascosphaera acerosa]
MPAKGATGTAAAAGAADAADATSPDSLIDHDAGLQYWSSLPPTKATMLGELGQFSWYTRIDLQGSRNFLAKVRRRMGAAAGGDGAKLARGVDCGAGVGRVTEGLVSKVCAKVDVVEPVEQFAQVVRAGALARAGVVEDVYVVGLEAWEPSKRYDLIWVQWCVGHLRDAELLRFLVRAKAALTDDAGLLCIKENNTTLDDADDLFDEEDSSVTRSDAKFRRLFAQAGLRLVYSEIQTGYPEKFNLLPVRSYALRPAEA